MQSTNGREITLHREETGNQGHPDSHGDRASERDGASAGNFQRERGDRATGTGDNSGKSRRPRPVTHGKTLGYLIDTAQDRIAQIDHKVASLLQEIELLNQERNGISDRLEGLKQSLADWEGRVASLSKVTSLETEVELFDPAEELTA